MAPNEALPEGTSKGKPSSKRALGLPSVFGYASIAVGLAIGMFALELLILSSVQYRGVHGPDWMNRLFGLSIPVVLIGVPVGLIFAWLGIRRNRTRHGRALSKVGLILILAAFSIYLLGWFLWFVTMASLIY